MLGSTRARATFIETQRNGLLAFYGVAGVPRQVQNGTHPVRGTCAHV
jgi:hypothetical protein